MSSGGATSNGSTTLNTGGAAGRWGASDAPSASPGVYNITNNNNINYNYGSNITAISSDGHAGGSVPTFQDLERQRQASGAGISGGLSSAMATVGQSEYLQSAASALQNSKGLQKTSDSIRRYTGFDLNYAIGGKTLAEKAEAKLAKEADHGYAGGSGYQGISIPIPPPQ